jgi:hypothetical protein
VYGNYGMAQFRADVLRESVRAKEGSGDSPYLHLGHRSLVLKFAGLGGIDLP